jgi:hypothetical protein
MDEMNPLQTATNAGSGTLAAADRGRFQSPRYQRELSPDGAVARPPMSIKEHSATASRDTALYTNLLACVGYLWLGTNAHLLARQEV